MLKDTITISCYLEVVVAAFCFVLFFFCWFFLPSQEKRQEVDLTHVNESEKALLIFS